MGNPTIKSRNTYLYQNLNDNSRTIIACAGDGTGVNSLTNNVLYWNGAGTPTSIFTPSVGATNPRMAFSRDYAYFADGVTADLDSWNIDVSTQLWGIAAPTSAITVGTPSGGSFTFALSAVANASAGSTVYTGVGLSSLAAGAIVTITGFLTSANNGVFTVSASSPTTVTVNNASGVAETDPGTLVTTNQLFPVTTTNGWGPNAHVGGYEGGVNLGYNFGLDPGTTGAYTNPNNAIDGNPATFAYAVGQHTHAYFGCVWVFPAFTGSLNNLTLNITSEVPVTGTDGFIVNNRSAAIYYSIDGGNTWTLVYNSQTRTKTTDTFPLASGQDLSKVQVMAFLDSHDDMYQKVYEIFIQGTNVGSGPITLLSGRYYYVSYINSTKENFSDLSPVSNFSGPIAGGTFPLTNLPVSSDPQVDEKVILATADGGDPTTLYGLAVVPNSQTTYVDTTPESAIVNLNIYQQTDINGNSIGLVFNQPPQNGSFPTVHKGRIFMALGASVIFSKTLTEVTTSSGIIAGRPEEDFPPQYQLNTSPGAEQIHGLLSDGYTLYIGTERHIRRLVGDDPTTFQLPNVVFSEAGLLNQNVWQIVFLEGTPIGCMWMTPDFRVIGSDFNTYNDVGTPIQTTLNSINQSAAQKCWGQFLGYGPYNFYVLAIPTGTNTEPDTLCIYDLHLRKWFIWKPADTCISSLYYVNLSGFPRFMMFTSDGTIRYMDPTLVADKQGEVDVAVINTLLQTSWLHLGDPTMRKVLNEIEVMTFDTGLLVTVEGAESAQDFLAPKVLLNNSPLTASQFGPLKAYMVGSDSRGRFYRFTFSSTSQVGRSAVTDTLLDYFSVNVLPMNRI